MKLFFIIGLLISQNVFADLFKEEAPRLADSLKKNLMGSLQHEFKKNGVIKAIAFCSTNAEKITQTSSKDLKGKYEFGRVSHKIRNSKNTPQDWMEAYLASFRDKKQGALDSSPIYQVTAQGKQVYLEPIWVVPMCIQCHGEHISKAVNDEITKRYPSDKARGFKVGDFRGFIWVKER